MTDIDAIRARHVPYTDTDDPPVTICVACSQPWGEAGCDAHQLGVALDDHQAGARALLGWRTDTQQRLDAAEAREATLRAAIERHLRHVSRSRDFDMDHEELRALAATARHPLPWMRSIG